MLLALLIDLEANVREIDEVQLHKGQIPQRTGLGWARSRCIELLKAVRGFLFIDRVWTFRIFLKWLLLILKCFHKLLIFYLELSFEGLIDFIDTV